MVNALGLVEYLKVPTGMVAADEMSKKANICIIHSAIVCPGKYIVLFKGSLSDVNAAIEVGTTGFEANLIDSFLLGNPNEQIYGAISGASSVEIKGAIGIVESYSVASIIEAADIALKSAGVDLVEVRLARGMCGKSFFLIAGNLSDVEMSVKNAKKYLIEKGMLIDAAVIASPSPDFVENLY